MKIPIQLPNPPEGYKVEAFIVANRKAKGGEWVLTTSAGSAYQCTGAFDYRRPILQLQKIEAPKPVIEAFEITEHQGYFVIWIDDCFEDLCDLMSRPDFRGFKFDGGDTSWAQPWAYQDPDGCHWPCQSVMDDRTLVRASHVLREV
jgi:hypothetical protein